MTNASPDVLVIGAGVSGLTTAVCLLDAGLSVAVRTAQLPDHTTSAVAGALWGPHLVGTGERERYWAAQTLDRLRLLAADPATTGVTDTAGLVAVAHASEDPPPFTRGAGELARCDRTELPAGFTVGWRYRAPVASMPAYLAYLTGELTGRGGRLQLAAPLRSLGEAALDCAAPVIVNCAGIGARELAADTGLTPVRGQVVTVVNPGLTDFFVGDTGARDRVTYVIPHGATALLGGTTEHGNASTVPDPATAARIISDCTAAEPRLAGAPVLAHRVGVRPVRPHVRLAPSRSATGASSFTTTGTAAPA